jgi:hypothetical protein
VRLCVSDAYANVCADVYESEYECIGLDFGIHSGMYVYEAQHEKYY